MNTTTKTLGVILAGALTLSANATPAEIDTISGYSYMTNYCGYTAYVFENTEAVGSVTFKTAGTVDLLVVGGGGAGGYMYGAGGGAGEMKIKPAYEVEAGVAYDIMVGAGGQPVVSASGENGKNSSFGSLVSAGGGGGAYYYASNGNTGGSGGGGCRYGAGGQSTATDGGLGNKGGDYNTTGVGSIEVGGGGGGAGGPGENGYGYINDDGLTIVSCGNGGPGVMCDYSGEIRWYAAGGGGGSAGISNWAYGFGGSGIGGRGAHNGEYGFPGKDGTGSGGGGAAYRNDMIGLAGRGGSGIVILRVGEIDAASTAPAGIGGCVKEVAADGATFCGRVLAFGAGATEDEVMLKYGISPNHLDYTSSFATVDALGDFTVVMSGLRPATKYYATLALANGDDETQISGIMSFVTLPEGAKAGLWQVKKDGYDTSVFEVAGSEDRVLATGAWAAHFSYPAHSWTIVKQDGTIADDYWTYKSGFGGPNASFGYEGLMWFEAKTYLFGLNIDDYGIICVGDDFKFEAGGRGSYYDYSYPHLKTETMNPEDLVPSSSSSWTCPKAGWYRVRVYSADAGGGVGAYGDFCGAGWSEDGGKTWNLFANEEGKVFLSTDADKIVTAKVTSEIITSGKASYQVEFDAANAGNTISAYWSDEYADTDLANWTSLEIDDTLGGDGVATFMFDVPETAKYLRFAVADDTTAIQETTAVPLAEAFVMSGEASAPSAAFISVGSVGRFTADINATIISCGEGSSDCSIVVNYGTDPETLDGEAEFTGLTVGTKVLTLTGLLPDTKYYATLHADNGSEVSEESEMFTFKTESGAAIATVSSVSASTYQISISGSVSDIGAGDGATVYFYAGESANVDDMTCYSSVKLDEAGPFAYVVEYPKVGITAYTTCMISNNYEGIVWTNWTSILPSQLQDNYSYYWKSDVHSGEWEDPDNWTAIPDSNGRAQYPNSSLNTVYFQTDDATQPVEILLNSYHSINVLRFVTPEMKISFTGVGKVDANNNPVSGIETSISWYPWDQALKNGMELTFKDMYLHSWCVPFYPGQADGATLTYDNVYCYFHTGLEIQASDVTMILKNGTYLSSVNDSMRVAGSNARIVVEDSMMEFPLPIDMGTTANASALFELKGTSPVISVPETMFKVSNAETMDPDSYEIRFYLPNGGYTRTPIVQNALWVGGNPYNESNLFAGNCGNPIMISMSRESPITSAVDTKLIENQYGIDMDNIVFSVPRSSYSFYLNDETAPTEVWGKYRASGLTVIVR